MMSQNEQKQDLMISMCSIMAIAASTLISVFVILCHPCCIVRCTDPPDMPRPAALFCGFTYVRAPAREKFHVHVHVLENAQMTPSNVPNTAMLTGTARTSVGTRPRQKTRPPDSAYILCALRHDEPRRPVSVSVPVPVIVPACKRVLRTSKGNVAIQPITPAAAPATSGGAQGWRYESVSVSSTTVSGCWCGCAGAGCTGVGAKRRSVPSYCWSFFHEFS